MKSKPTLLTLKFIDKLEVKANKYRVFEEGEKNIIGSFGVTVYPSGAKSYVYRYFDSETGRVVFITILDIAEISLDDARNVAFNYSEQLKQKKCISRDTYDNNIVLTKKGTFGELISGYVSQMKTDGKRTYASVYARIEKEVFTLIPISQQANTVTTLQIKQVLSKMIHRNAVVQSNRIRSYLHAAFNFGIKADNDPAKFQGNVIFDITINPVGVIPPQRSAEKPGTHYLNWEELAILLVNIKRTPKVGFKIAHLILLCIFLGGQRPYEISNLKWDNVDLKKKNVMIPQEISKNKREHLIPMNNIAFDIFIALKKLDVNDGFIFSSLGNKNKTIGSTTISHAIKYFLKQNINVRDFCPRDLRRTCKTLMGELGVSKDIRDRLQNYAFNDVSSRHYDMWDYRPEKEMALLTWENQIIKILKNL